jgi:hypothetical protein
MFLKFSVNTKWVQFSNYDAHLFDQPADLSHTQKNHDVVVIVVIILCRYTDQ